MSLIVTGLVLGGVLATVGTVAVAFGRRRRVPLLPATPALEEGPPGLVALGFAADVGDVVSVARQELWLEDAWLLREGEPVAAIYFAGEGALALLPEPSDACYRLRDIAVVELLEPPTVMEHAGQHYTRWRRRPVTVEARGRQPAPFTAALLVEYTGLAGEVLWLVAGQEGWRAWLGSRCAQSDFERWGPGGPSSPSVRPAG